MPVHFAVIVPPQLNYLAREDPVSCFSSVRKAVAFGYYGALVMSGRILDAAADAG